MNDTTQLVPKITTSNFTRVKNDINGNGRYVIHFVYCMNDTIRKMPAGDGFGVTDKYSATCALMRKIGGKAYRGKEFGGGIVFQSVNLNATIKDIGRVISA